MSDYESDNLESTVRMSRPSVAQVKALIAFMEKHPNLAHKKLRGVGHAKFQRLWVQLTEIVNKLDGALKSTKGWIKFWSDKRRSILMKKKQLEEGKGLELTLLEQKILNLCEVKSSTPGNITRPLLRHRQVKRKAVKQEQINGDEDDDILDDIISKDDDYSQDDCRINSAEVEERQLTMIEKLADVMDQQSAAMNQMAQASLCNAKALERIAEASHIQALAVDRVAGTFETISASVHDVRNAILGIDYTLKRCYPATVTHRPNTNIFS